MKNVRLVLGIPLLALMLAGITSVNTPVLADGGSPALDSPPPICGPNDGPPFCPPQ